MDRSHVLRTIDRPILRWRQIDPVGVHEMDPEKQGRSAADTERIHFSAALQAISARGVQPHRHRTFESPAKSRWPGSDADGSAPRRLRSRCREGSPQESGWPDQAAHTQVADTMLVRIEGCEQGASGRVCSWRNSECFLKQRSVAASLSLFGVVFLGSRSSKMVPPGCLQGDQDNIQLPDSDLQEQQCKKRSRQRCAPRRRSAMPLRGVLPSGKVAPRPPALPPTPAGRNSGWKHVNVTGLGFFLLGSGSPQTQRLPFFQRLVSIAPDLGVVVNKNLFP